MQQFTDAEKAILTGVAYSADFGCDVLDDAGNVTDTLDSDLVGCTVTHAAHAQVHRTVEVDVQRQLDWQHVWLRPWQTVSDADGNSTRAYHLGVFRPEVPELPMGSTPVTWHVLGSDRLSLLLAPICDNRWSEAAAVAQTEIRNVITESGVPGGILAATDTASAALSTRLAWVLDPGAPTTFLRRINDLAEATGIRGVFMDGDGRFRLEVYRTPDQRAATWLFDLTDTTTNIIAVDRTATTSARNPVNWWRFVAQNWPTYPVEGNGQYTVDLTGGGTRYGKPVSLSAADQASLQAQGDQTVAADQGRTRTVDYKTGPFPIFEHFDIVDVIDPELDAGARTHAQVSQWSCDLAARTTTFTVEVPLV